MDGMAVYDATFMRNLSIIAEDEKLVKRLIKYVTRLAHQEKDVSQDADPELAERFRQADDDFRNGKTYAMLPGESFTDFCNRIGK